MVEIGPPLCVPRKRPPSASVYFVLHGIVPPRAALSPPTGCVRAPAKQFRELGLIDYNGHIEVHSSLLNVVLRDQPQIKS
jgi:hypothetical protein